MDSQGNVHYNDTDNTFTLLTATTWYKENKFNNFLRNLFSIHFLTKSYINQWQKKWIIDGHDNKRISNCHFTPSLGAFNLFLYSD